MLIYKLMSDIFLSIIFFGSIAMFCSFQITKNVFIIAIKEYNINNLMVKKGEKCKLDKKM